MTSSSDTSFPGTSDMDETDISEPALDTVDVNNAEVDSDEELEPWPPPEWRESSRSLGRREAAMVFGAIFGIIGALVLVAIWAANNG